MPAAEEFVCETTKGAVEITLRKDWAPLGAKRFEELVDAGFFINMPLSRCIRGFLCQFGYKPPSHLRPANEEWSPIADDDESTSPRHFQRGYLSFAGNGRDSRTNHLFVTLGEDVTSLGTQPWETPIGYVSAQSMASSASLWDTRYGEGDKAPNPDLVTKPGGADYLAKRFPKLDYIKFCRRRAVAAARTLVVDLELAPKLDGRVRIELYEEWAPLGVERVRSMLEARFLDQARFFRVVPGFVVQFGMPGDPERAKEFPKIKDDPVKYTNERGTVTFAMAGKDTRTFQLFINLHNNARLDSQQFAPIGRVIEGMDLITKIYSNYGEQPDQGEISRHGNAYLEKHFPKLSYISKARLVVGEEGVQQDVPTAVSMPPASSTRHSSQFELGFSLLMILFVVVGSVLLVRRLFAYPSSGGANSPGKRREAA